jgi:predicted metalloendopeptidase
MDKLVLALEKSLGDDIQTLPWMSDETKKAAEEKLSLIRNKIGYPEKWRDYSKLKVKRTICWEICAARRFSSATTGWQAGQAGG